VGQRYLNIEISEFVAPNIIIGGGNCNNTVFAPVLVQ